MVLSELARRLHIVRPAPDGSLSPDQSIDLLRQIAAKAAGADIVFDPTNIGLLSGEIDLIRRFTPAQISHTLAEFSGQSPQQALEQAEGLRRLGI